MAYSGLTLISLTLISDLNSYLHGDRLRPARTPIGKVLDPGAMVPDVPIVCGRINIVSKGKGNGKG